MRYALTAEELCKKLRPIFGQKIDRLYLQYTLTDSREKRAEIEQALGVLYEKHLNTTLLNETVLLPPPAKDAIAGAYPLGIVSYADKQLYPFGLREQDWIRHVCISGMSGSGKTMLAFVILKNMLKNKKPFIVFDWKRSFRPLLKQDKDILCFTVGNSKIANLFKININRPPKGISPKEWVGILADLITESFFASYGVHKLLTEALDRAFRDFGVYKGSENYPTWYQIRDRLEEAADSHRSRGRESEWYESALRIAHALTFGYFGEAICSKDKYSLEVEELMNQKVIFELRSLNSAEKKFFCEFLLSYIYFAKKSSEETCNQFKNIILVDEAHNIFLKDRPTFTKESVTDVVYRELREYGVGLICLDQHVSKLSDAVAGNSATNIAFHQMLPKDVDTIANLMQLWPEKKFFTMLPVGSAIVKLAERHYTPFLINIPFIELKEENVTDDFIKNQMTQKIKFSKRMKIFKESVSDEYIAEKIKKLDTVFRASGTRPLKGDIKELVKQTHKSKNSEDAEIYLEECKDAKPFLSLIKRKKLPTTKIYKELKLSARKGNEIKKTLLYLDLIKEQEIRSKKGWKKILELTDKGKASA
jgi:hypothetical protein